MCIRDRFDIFIRDEYNLTDYNPSTGCPNTYLVEKKIIEIPIGFGYKIIDDEKKSFYIELAYEPSAILESSDVVTNNSSGNIAYEFILPKSRSYLTSISTSTGFLLKINKNIELNTGVILKTQDLERRAFLIGGNLRLKYKL